MQCKAQSKTWLTGCWKNLYPYFGERPCRVAGSYLILPTPGGGGHLPGPKSHPPTPKIFPPTHYPPGGGVCRGPDKATHFLTPENFSRAYPKITIFSLFFSFRRLRRRNFSKKPKFGPSKMHFWALFGTLSPKIFSSGAFGAKGKSPLGNPLGHSERPLHEKNMFFFKKQKTIDLNACFPVWCKSVRTI